MKMSRSASDLLPDFKIFSDPVGNYVTFMDKNTYFILTTFTLHIQCIWQPFLFLLSLYNHFKPFLKF